MAWVPSLNIRLVGKVQGKKIRNYIFLSHCSVPGFAPLRKRKGSQNCRTLAADFNLCYRSLFIRVEILC